MATKEYIIYEDQYFIVEWYYDERGRSQALEYFEELSNHEKAKFMSLVVHIAKIGKIFNKTKFNNEGDQIYAFKPMPHRFLCFFFKGKKIIVTNGFHKKQQKLPANEKVRAINYMQSYFERITKGDYYD
jgi:Phage derived protein Gp49-like (DUF891)